MAVLTAEFPPTTGDALLDSYSVTFQPEKTRQRIGYCPQFDAHFTNMTGREHIELYAAIKGLPKSAIKGAVASKLAEVGLSEYDGNRLSSQYSGGMKRKLSVAIATIGSPPIVFLDEPSTGMVGTTLFSIFMADLGLWSCIIWCVAHTIAILPHDICFFSQMVYRIQWLGETYGVSLVTWCPVGAVAAELASSSPLIRWKSARLCVLGSVSWPRASSGASVRHRG